MKIKFAELHSPLFFGSRNFSTKLDVVRYAGLRLDYDRKEKELIAVYNNQMAIIPSSNVASMVIDDGVVDAARPINPIPIKVKAQASTPQGIKND